MNEANNNLPSVNQEVNALQLMQQKFLTKYEDLKKLRMRLRKDFKREPLKEKIFIIEAQLEFINVLAKTHINNIQAKGGFLRDIQHGVVDFPGLMNDRFVYFSWQRGENEIQYFHEKTDRYKDRKRIH